MTDKEGRKMLRQSDFIIDEEDKRATGGNRELDAIIRLLPATPLLRAYDITEATGISAQVIGNLRESGAFTSFNLGSRDNPRYRYSRKSFIEWLKSRMSEGGPTCRA